MERRPTCAWRLRGVSAVGRGMRRAIGIGAILTAVAFAGCAAFPQTVPAQHASPAPKPLAPDRGVDPDQAAAGWRVAKDHCAACHAIDATSSSPNREAPPLRHVLEIYPPDMLAERFIEGMRVGHDDMPRFDFNVIAADALVAYLKSIRDNSPEVDTRPGS